MNRVIKRTGRDGRKIWAQIWHSFLAEGQMFALHGRGHKLSKTKTIGLEAGRRDFESKNMESSNVVFSESFATHTIVYKYPVVFCEIFKRKDHFCSTEKSLVIIQLTTLSSCKMLISLEVIAVCQYRISYVEDRTLNLKRTCSKALVAKMVIHRGTCPAARPDQAVLYKS